MPLHEYRLLVLLADWNWNRDLMYEWDGSPNPIVHGIWQAADPFFIEWQST